MKKKLAIMMCALCVIAGSVQAAENNNTADKSAKMKNRPSQEEMIKIRKAKEAAFEQKLGLTDEQKVKAKTLRQEGFEKIKPVMDEMHKKRMEAKNIRKSELSAEAKEEQLTAIDKELQELEKKAAKIKKQNMKDFESILNKDQKTTLKNMKQQGRKNFERERRLNPHPMPRPEFEK